MSASIRGHQSKFEIYKDGALVKIVNIKSLDVNQDSTFMKSYYAGNSIPEGDQAIEGWSGSLELEVKDSSVDDFIDALVTDNLNGIGASDYSFIDTELYADGTQKSWGYFDSQFKMTKHRAGLQEKQTKKLEFQSMVKKPL